MADAALETSEADAGGVFSDDSCLVKSERSITLPSDR